MGEDSLDKIDITLFHFAQEFSPKRSQRGKQPQESTFYAGFFGLESNLMQDETKKTCFSLWEGVG